ncbi:PilZ domain-containing protein [Neorhodopirellula lusitana]|uniref:PilZ domain-containing protein n=1 Tax=Neorhodopirellula lusitana TaxID=445327 RepID=A0ABY1Q1V2_9BACT|nr:PilZ domain-containing protein [Neorhodopirellula lusitana]SMP56787.1 PilZ domain-containing protein [Neorhodopirellula lusitana]
MTSSPSTISSSQHRNCDRFVAKNSGELKAELLVLRDDEVITYPCQLADISSGGCAVRATLIRPDEVSVAVLRVKDASGKVDLEMAGRLCWNQQTSVGSNTFGFRFRREMPDETIDFLVSQGFVTRRQEQRISAGTPVQIRRAYGLPSIESATLEDFSTTGVRLHIDHLVDAGERLLVSTSGPDTAQSSDLACEASKKSSGSVTVKWVRPIEGRYECGCVFQNLASSRAINDTFGALA